jgi:CheY-like chemotaxis protein
LDPVLEHAAHPEVGREGPGPLRSALVVDDETLSRTVIVRMMRDAGYDVREAASGREAMETFRRHGADLVLLDVRMPDIDGYEVARSLRAHRGDAPLQIIFLTGLTNEQALAECVRAGGDDFVSKPVSRTILRAKLEGLQRTRRMHRTIHEHAEELSGHHERLGEERALARRVLVDLQRRNAEGHADVKVRTGPAATDAGSIVLVARRPDGGPVVLHTRGAEDGLHGAMMTLRIAETFQGRVAEGRELREVVEELDRLHAGAGPGGSGRWIAAAEVDPADGHAVVWNGGPGGIVLERAGGERVTVPANLRPLGGHRPGRIEPDFLEVSAGDRLQFQDAPGPDSWAPDPPVAEILVEEPRPVPRPEDEAPGEAEPEPRAGSRIRLDLDAPVLAGGDPVLQLHQFLDSLPGIEPRRPEIFLILTELFYNALDHGLLRLDRTVRDGPDGFSRYQAERSRRRRELTEGSVTIELTHEARDGGGTLHLLVQDSGPGFDVANLLAGNDGSGARGILLVRSLCRELCYGAGGSRAEATYEW